MNSKLSALILTAALTTGCTHPGNHSLYRNQLQKYHQPAQQQTVVQQPAQQPKQVSHEDMIRWYRARAMKHPHKELEGRVNPSSEFMAVVIDQQTYSPPELKFDDWYPTSEFYPGDLLGLICFAKNNETTAAHLMFYSPSGGMIDGKGFAVNAKESDHIVGRTYDVSRLIENYGEGVYQCKWFFHLIHVKTSVAELKR